LRRKNLRTPLKSDLVRRLPGQTVLAISRRAKFLLIETEDFFLLSHLGMTGAWRLESEGFVPLKHDHVILTFESGRKYVYNDPRRFGVLELIPKAKFAVNKWLKNLGVEPLGEGFTAEMLFSLTRKRKAPIKGILMDQRHVVGVGNIYASEALFAARVSPRRPAGRLKLSDAERLVQSVRAILLAAIEAGGSTISDYRNSKGESGSFQDRFLVYDRESAPCPDCGNPIRGARDRGPQHLLVPKMPAVILAAYASLFTLGLLDNVRGPFLLEIQQDLGLSATGGSAFFGAASLLSFFGAYYAHRLLLRRDALSVLAAVSVVFALGFAGVSRSPDLLMLLVSRPCLAGVTAPSMSYKMSWSAAGLLRTCADAI
jgi:formamidopyrimidine-DNA glycosylase